MRFKEVLRQVVEWLREDGRVSHLALKRQFDIGDDDLEDVKESLLYTHADNITDDGQGLIWSGSPCDPAPNSHSETDRETRFQALIPEVIAFIQRHRRVTYRRLTVIFGLDDKLLGQLRNELLFQQVVRDEQGEGLVWAGEAAPTFELANVSMARPDIALEIQPNSADSLLSDAAPPTAERRQLTVMFCDLVGSTDLSRKLDPEDLREVVRAYQEAAAEIIKRYEGHVAQYLGDGLLVYFGYPVAHEDDAQRAVHTGLEIPEAISTLNTRLDVEHGVKLAVRIGIHTGPVVVGEIGGGGRYENLALGETPNIAARLEGLATPNTVVISPVTARLIHSAFVLEELGVHELKGVKEPMAIIRVISPQEAPFKTTEWDDRGFASLVGRDEEVGLILRRWEQSKSGLGQVVLISGEAGIGKSSLIGGIRSQAHQEGLTRIAIRCSPYATNSALYPIIEYLERALQFSPDDTADHKLTILEHTLEQTNLVLNEAVPLLASLLSIPIPEGHYQELAPNPQRLRQQTQDTLVAWLLEAAEQQPVLVVWEDLHWADPSTLDVLRLVIDQTPTVSMLHVLTFRPEFEPSWSMRSHMTPLPLNRLERAQVEALMIRLSGGKTLPEEVREHIIAKTDGVPLYVEELTKMLLSSGLLNESADHYVLAGPLVSVMIPDTLHDSLMARLDQMTTAKEIAQLGAVIGREFSYDMIKVISHQNDERLQMGLTQLVEAELLYQRGRPPRARYLFKHALIQDTAYASLLRNTRQHYHRQIAEHMAVDAAEIGEVHPELVARHFTEAECIEEAISYWQKAGTRAIASSAFVEATAHFTQAISVLSKLPETSERKCQELGLHVLVGPALMATRGAASPEVSETYSKIEALAAELQETVTGLWLFYYMRGDIERAREHGSQLMNLAESQQDPSLLFDGHLVLGITMFRLGVVDQALNHLEKSSQYYDAKIHHAQTFLYGVDPGVFALCYTARAMWLKGHPEQAIEQSQAAIHLAERLSHPFSKIYTLAWTVVLHLLRRDWPAVEQCSEEVIAQATEYGFPFLAEVAQIAQARVRFEQGETEQGMIQMRDRLAGPRAAGMDQGLPYSLALLAEMEAQLNPSGDTLKILDEALGIAQRAGGRYWEAELLRLKGDLSLHQASPDTVEAERFLYQALETAQRQQVKSWELRAATSLARLWQSQGKRLEAHDVIAPVYTWFTEGFDTADLQDAKVLLAELQV